MNEFIKSILVQPPRVLGRQLLPFSAYHVAALSALDSPLISQQGHIGPQDLILAVFVCSKGFEDGPPSLSDPDTDDIANWGHQYDFETESAAFNSYLDEYLEMPDLWEPDGGTSRKTSPVPAAFHAVATVLQNMNGITEAQAWDMPFNRLVSYRACIAETHGWDIVDSTLIAIKEAIEARSKQKDRGEREA